jgi:hypothetical protein
VVRELVEEREKVSVYEPTISYSIKDILNRVEGKLDAALIAVATKAEHSELLKLDVRVTRLELSEANKAETRTWRHQWRQLIWPTLIGIAMLAVTIISLLK